MNLPNISAESFCSRFGVKLNDTEVVTKKYKGVLKTEVEWYEMLKSKIVIARVPQIMLETGKAKPPVSKEDEEEVVARRKRVEVKASVVPTTPPSDENSETK